ncbi:unnamed protein product, partial [marine sediment metagenome]
RDSNPLYFYAEGSKRQNPLGILSVTHRARHHTMVVASPNFLVRR